MRGNGYKSKQENFRMDIFFTIRTVKQWNRLPQKIVQFPSSEVFKIQLDNDLSNLA